MVECRAVVVAGAAGRGEYIGRLVRLCGSDPLSTLLFSLANLTSRGTWLLKHCMKNDTCIAFSASSQLLLLALGTLQSGWLLHVTL